MGCCSFRLLQCVCGRLDVDQGPKVTVKQTRGKSLLGCQGCRGFQPYGRLSLDPRCHVSLWFSVLGFGLGFCLGLIPSSEAAGSWLLCECGSVWVCVYVSMSVMCAHRPAHEPRTKRNEDKFKFMHVSRVHVSRTVPGLTLVMQMCDGECSGKTGCSAVV